MEFANFELELFTKVADGLRPAPAFNGILKSAENGEVMFDEISTYVLFGIIDSFFRDNRDKHIFYETVPVGYGIMGMASVGYLVCMEVIGEAFITPCSKPFFISSTEHTKAINDIPGCKDYLKKRHTLDCSQQLFEACSKLNDKSVVTKAMAKDGMFWKVIRFDAFSAKYFAQMFKVYSKYMELNESDLKTHNLLPAQLLYGELEVAIRTGFLQDF